MFQIMKEVETRLGLDTAFTPQEECLSHIGAVVRNDYVVDENGDPVGDVRKVFVLSKANAYLKSANVMCRERFGSSIMIRVMLHLHSDSFHTAAKWADSFVPMLMRVYEENKAYMPDFPGEHMTTGILHREYIPILAVKDETVVGAVVFIMDDVEAEIDTAYFMAGGVEKEFQRMGIMEVLMLTGLGILAQIGLGRKDEVIRKALAAYKDIEEECKEMGKEGCKETRDKLILDNYNVYHPFEGEEYETGVEENDEKMDANEDDEEDFMRTQHEEHLQTFYNVKKHKKFAWLLAGNGVEYDTAARIPYVPQHVGYALAHFGVDYGNPNTEGLFKVAETYGFSEVLELRQEGEKHFGMPIPLEKTDMIGHARFLFNMMMARVKKPLFELAMGEGGAFESKIDDLVGGLVDRFVSVELDDARQLGVDEEGEKRGGKKQVA